MRESGLHQLYMVANSLQCVKLSGDRSGDTDNGRQSNKNNSCSSTSSSTSSSSNNGSDNFTPTAPGVDEKTEESVEINIGIGRPSLVSFTRNELESVRDIALSQGCLGLLVASLCPTIFGHELVKLGLLLGTDILKIYLFCSFFFFLYEKY